MLIVSSLMMDPEEEPDEDEQFLHSAMEIVEEFSQGGEVSRLMEHLKIPTHSFDSEATRYIYNVLKFIEHSPQSDSINSFTAHSSSPIFHNCQTDRTLCLSPTKQIGINIVEDIQETSGKTTQQVPGLSLDFSPSQSIHRSSLSSTDMSADSTRCSGLRYSPHRCKKCYTQSGTLNMSDFLYLAIFGLGVSIMFYYLYYPKLYKDPVF